MSEQIILVLLIFKLSSNSSIMMDEDYKQMNEIG